MQFFLFSPVSTVPNIHVWPSIYLVFSLSLAYSVSVMWITFYTFYIRTSFYVGRTSSCQGHQYGIPGSNGMYSITTSRDWHFCATRSELVALAKELASRWGPTYKGCLRFACIRAFQCLRFYLFTVSVHWVQNIQCVKYIVTQSIVPQCLSPRPNWDPSPPLPQASVSPPKKNQRGGPGGTSQAC
jgi:hypothetical protein